MCAVRPSGEYLARPEMSDFFTVFSARCGDVPKTFRKLLIDKRNILWHGMCLIGCSSSL